MFTEASLHLTLRVDGPSVRTVLVRSSRMVQAARLFAGKQPVEVLQLLPAVFSLCGSAQALTGLAAMEKAAAIAASPAQKAARNLLLLAESVSEHGLTIARDWPLLAGAAPSLDHAKRLRHALAGLRKALYPDGDWLHLGGGQLAPDTDTIASIITQCRDTLTQLVGNDLDEVVQPIAFQAWLQRESNPLLALVTSRCWQGLGASAAFMPMPERGPPDLSARLQTDREGIYLARPDCAGRVFETGPLAHWYWHPLLTDLTDRFGTGLMTRLAARLVLLAESLREMAEHAHDLRAEPAAPLPRLDGHGLALTEAARGMLAHRVVLKEGLVGEYQILAPTEWNFHPEGPLVRMLTGAPADQDLELRARLLVHAMDPCVACTIEVE
ncbi:MAG: nickel-dependent hydrogenase large subunit [Magnetospirillum sp.]